jgi:plasmid maintenance system killer protein
MIVSFKHRGLKRLYLRGDRRRINPLYLEKIELILADLVDYH